MALSLILLLLFNVDKSAVMDKFLTCKQELAKSHSPRVNSKSPETSLVIPSTISKFDEKFNATPVPIKVVPTNTCITSVSYTHLTLPTTPYV